MNEAEKKRRFHEIVLEHSDILHRIARRQLSLNGGTYDWGRVEEAVQETLTLAWIKRDEVLAAPNIGGWLVKTLQYVLKNMVRQDQQWSKRLLLAQKDLGPDPIQPSPGAHLELEDLVTPEESSRSMWSASPTRNCAKPMASKNPLWLCASSGPRSGFERRI